jgi:5-methylcytosine-specific restriction endonuclease McrA
MGTTDFWTLGAVSDEQLRVGLAVLLASGARTEARIVAHLAEVLARKLYLRDGSASAFDYCQTRLALSASEAFHRLTAANIARKFPVVFTMLERREVHLSGVCLLRDYLTPANHRQLLAEASHKTKLQILELLARRFPRPDVTSRIRKLPPLGSRHIRVDPCLRATPATPATPAAPAAPATPAALATPSAVATPGQLRGSGEPRTSAVRDESMPMPASAVLSPRPAGGAGAQLLLGVPASLAISLRSALPIAPRRARVEPLSESRYRIQLNASVTLKDKLELLRSLLSHSIPSGDLAAVVERAVELALEQVQKKRFAKTEKARTSPARNSKQNLEAEGHRAAGETREHTRRTSPARITSQSAGKREHIPNATQSSRTREHIPNATQRTVVARDGLRCTYISGQGYRCTARSFLQFHHEQPWARGGEATPQNLRMLCAAHNDLLAERDFGAAHLAERKAARRRRSERSSA